MGIPYLRKHVRPYGEKIVLAKREGGATTGSPTRLVVDGPSLAYHVYHRLYRQLSTDHGPFHGVPSYQQLSRGIVEYLQKLEEFGLNM